MSRPDLSWLREAVGLGAVFNAIVGHRDPDRGLVELMFDGGTLLAWIATFRSARPSGCGFPRAK